MENGVATLVNHGHPLHRIKEYTLPQFMIMLRAAERRDAEKRTQFITDMSAAIGALFGGGESLTKHLADLQQFIEEKQDVSGKRP
jgi:hypothetical protein